MYFFRRKKSHAAHYTVALVMCSKMFELLILKLMPSELRQEKSKMVHYLPFFDSYVRRYYKWTVSKTSLNNVKNNTPSPSSIHLPLFFLKTYS